MSRGRPILSDAEVDERRARILGAVLAQISERGAAGVRMKDVARSAQLSVGSIQYYFDSREDLVFQAFEAHSARVIGRVRRAGARDLDPWACLVQSFHDFLHVEGFTSRSRLWMEFVAASTRDPQLRELLDGVFQAWKDLVRSLVTAGIASGDFHPLIAQESVVDCLLAQLDGFEIAHATGSQGTEVARIEAVLRDSAAALLGVEGTAERSATS